MPCSVPVSEWFLRIRQQRYLPWLLSGHQNSIAFAKPPFSICTSTNGMLSVPAILSRLLFDCLSALQCFRTSAKKREFHQIRCSRLMSPVIAGAGVRGHEFGPSDGASLPGQSSGGHPCCLRQSQRGRPEAAGPTLRLPSGAIRLRLHSGSAPCCFCQPSQ